MNQCYKKLSNGNKCHIYIQFPSTTRYLFNFNTSHILPTKTRFGTFVYHVRWKTISTKPSLVILDVKCSVFQG